MATKAALGGEKTPLMKTKGAVKNLSLPFFKLRNPSAYQDTQAVSAEDNTRLRYVLFNHITHLIDSSL